MCVCVCVCVSVYFVLFYCAEKKYNDYPLSENRSRRKKSITSMCFMPEAYRIVTVLTTQAHTHTPTHTLSVTNTCILCQKVCHMNFVFCLLLSFYISFHYFSCFVFKPLQVALSGAAAGSSKRNTSSKKNGKFFLNIHKLIF